MGSPLWTIGITDVGRGEQPDDNADGWQLLRDVAEVTGLPIVQTLEGPAVGDIGWAAFIEIDPRDIPPIAGCWLTLDVRGDTVEIVTERAAAIAEGLRAAGKPWDLVVQHAEYGNPDPG